MQRYPYNGIPTWDPKPAAGGQKGSWPRPGPGAQPGPRYELDLYLCIYYVYT